MEGDTQPDTRVDTRPRNRIHFSVVLMYAFYVIIGLTFISSRKDDSFLQLQYFWTCSCVLVTFSMFLTETSEP